MSQQINLFNPALIEKTTLVTPIKIAGLLGVMFIGLIAYAMYENSVLSQLKIDRQTAAQTLATVQTELKALAQSKNTNNTQALLTQIEQLEQQETTQQNILKAVGSSQDRNTYAAVLRAFANQNVDGLWITGLNINQDAENLSITGRTLDADLVPMLIAKLHQEPVLKGKVFTDLVMTAYERKVEDSETRNNMQQKDVDKQASKSAGEQLKEEFEIPEYIEFSLRSVPDTENEKNNKVANIQNNKVAGVNH